jgi:BarA-like signal transduction histidine kinase
MDPGEPPHTGLQQPDTILLKDDLGIHVNSVNVAADSTANLITLDILTMSSALQCVFIMVLHASLCFRHLDATELLSIAGKLRKDQDMVHAQVMTASGL